MSKLVGCCGTGELTVPVTAGVCILQQPVVKGKVYELNVFGLLLSWLWVEVDKIDTTCSPIFSSLLDTSSPSWCRKSFFFFLLPCPTNPSLICVSALFLQGKVEVRTAGVQNFTTPEPPHHVLWSWDLPGTANNFGVWASWSDVVSARLLNSLKSLGCVPISETGIGSWDAHRCAFSMQKASPEM